MYRISQSTYRDTFVLKGALLFELWTDQTHRPTRDADFLSREENNLERFQKIFEEICALKVEDPAADGAQDLAHTGEVQPVRTESAAGSRFEPRALEDVSVQECSTHPLRRVYV